MSLNSGERGSRETLPPLLPVEEEEEEEEEEEVATTILVLLVPETLEDEEEAMAVLEGVASPPAPPTVASNGMPSTVATASMSLKGSSVNLRTSTVCAYVC
jgi:hypothetical protein